MLLHDASSPGEPRHPSQNAQRSFLPCVYVYFRRRENIENKNIIIVCLLNLMAWKASWAHRTCEKEKKLMAVK